MECKFAEILSMKELEIGKVLEENSQLKQEMELKDTEMTRLQ